MNAITHLALEKLHESPWNPRRTFDPGPLKELAVSLGQHGVLTPLLARQNAKGYEIAAGHRRFRAAKIAGLAEVPVIVREMDDSTFLEVLVLENNQREDVHPLEEATGYEQLLKRAGYDVATIAAKVGRSIKYVYDRVKLLELTQPAQELFRTGMMTAGHAILLARLDAKDQARAIGNLRSGTPGGLFTDQRLLTFHPDADGAKRDLAAEFKAVSVREFQSWIDKHTKLEPAQADPMLFPETVETLTTAAETSEKVVRITHDDITPEEARDGKPIILGRSWKRADGKATSKTCDHSVIGMIVIGPGRGEALRVCVAKEKCEVHWAERVKAVKARASAAAKAEKAALAGAAPDASKEDRKRIAEDAKRKAAEEARRKQEAEAELREARWEKARPAITTAFASAVKKAPAGAGGALGKLLLRFYDDNARYGAGGLETAARLVGRGKTGDDLVRHLAFGILLEDLGDVYDEEGFFAQAKAIGVDVPKILQEAIPQLTAAATKKPVAKGPLARKKSKARRG